MTELSFIPLLHFWVGTLAVCSGFGAMLFRKGGRLHRLIGTIFVVTMVFLCLSGLYLSATRSIVFTAFLSLFSLYLVTTGWVSAKRRNGEAGWFEKIACMGIILFALSAAITGFKAVTGDAFLTKDVPAATYFILSGLAILCAALDIKLLRRYGLSGKHRIARHIWRVGFSLVIAVTIFFLGNNDVLPEFLRKPAFLFAPIVAAFLLTAFWIVRVLRAKSPLSGVRSR